MDILRAKEIIECLADGVNPLTGQVLPPGDSCNQAEVIRAFHAVLSALPEKTQKPQPENAGKPWTSADDSRLAAMYDEGKTRKEICEYFKRSSGGIASRLVHLGKISGKDGFEKRIGGSHRLEVTFRCRAGSGLSPQRTYPHRTHYASSLSSGSGN